MGERASCPCGKPEGHIGRCPGLRVPEKRGTFYAQRRAFEVALIRRTLEEHRGNRTHAARALGLQRTYLLRLMREYHVRERSGIDLRVLEWPR